VHRLALSAVIVGFVGCVWAPAAPASGPVSGSPFSSGVSAWSAAAGRPTATISTPASGGTYNLHQQVATGFSCSAPPGGTLTSCADSNGASGGTGALNTSKAGLRSYTVTATDADGQTGTATINYTVIGPPTAKITAPAAGQAYEPGQAVSTNFTCSEAPGGPGITTCTDSNGSGSPGRLSTTSAGGHVYTVTATSSDGLSSVARIIYHVIGRPLVKIAVPAPRQVFSLGQPVTTSFSCIPASRGPQIRSCLDAAGHASPATLDTAKLGGHRYTATATANDGQSTTSTVGYFVAAAPTASVSTPHANARYARGSRVLAAYACKEGRHGPGLTECAGTVANGSPIDTAAPGYHKFVVTAVSSDGQRSTTTVAYTVVLPNNHFNVTRVKLGRHGVLRVWILLPGPGSLFLREQVRTGHRHRTFVFARRHREAAAGGLVRLTIKPNRRGRRYVRRLNHRLTVKLYISYRPTNGFIHRRRLVVRGPRLR
jgi:hypothetical protein